MYKKWIFASLAATVSVSLLAQPEEKKDTGYLLAVTDTNILLSKKPLPADGPAVMIMKKEDDVAEKEKSAPSQEKPQGEAPKTGQGDSVDKEPSGNSFVMAGGGMFVTDDGGAIYSIPRTADTEVPEGLKRGTKVFVFYKMDGESKIALRVERVKEN